jgi:ADP-heptose:LPS heptosyltransferase
MNLKATLLKLIARKKYNGDIDAGRLQRILIVRPAKIGDTLCLFPLIRELKKALPNTRIDVYAGVHNNFMFRYLPQVSQVYTQYRNRNWLRTLTEVIRMRHNRYDLIIDTMEIKFGKVLSLMLINPAWLIGSSGFASRYGLSNCDLGLYYRLVEWKREHTTERMLGFLQPLGILDYDDTMEFPIGEDSSDYARRFLKPYSNRRLIGLNAEASDQARSIHDAEIIEICRNIHQRDDNATIVLFSSPHKRAHVMALVDQARLQNVILEQGSRNIFDAAALVSQLDVMITPDTSFIHIASAFDIPTVGIYPKDDEHLVYWGPRSSRYRVIFPPRADTGIRGFSNTLVVDAALDLLQPGESGGKLLRSR